MSEGFFLFRKSFAIVWINDDKTDTLYTM